LLRTRKPIGRWSASIPGEDFHPVGSRRCVTVAKARLSAVEFAMSAWTTQPAGSRPPHRRQACGSTKDVTQNSFPSVLPDMISLADLLRRV
jgi:hypothetical protein